MLIKHSCKFYLINCIKQSRYSIVYFHNEHINLKACNTMHTYMRFFRTKFDNARRIENYITKNITRELYYSPNINKICNTMIKKI